jgi:hypothetical protein
MATLQTILDTIVEALSKRQKDIITQRFGLGVKARTLAFLGNKYGITRERVRQIESATLKVLQRSAKENSQLRELFGKVEGHLSLVGGARRADFLVDDLKFVLKDKTVSEPYVALLFALFGSPELFVETNEFYPFWYSDKQVLQRVKQFTQKVGSFLKNKKEALIERGEFDTLFAQVTKQNNVKEFVALNYLLVSKDFYVNPYGDFGLMDWPEIAPRTMRDKAYLVLKKRKSPMHFREIAQEINRIKFDSKKAHPQTVHNELIKANERFVLVGRGLYSLREFGLEPGTTKDVLLRLLKKNGPMHFDKIVKLVSQERVLKNNTIFLNLQNKKLFKKNDKGHYHIA